jgi:aspartate aminotransferase
MADPDPILGLVKQFQLDPAKGKINLAIGAYRDEEGKPYLMPCIDEATKRLAARKLDHEYCDMTGVADFIRSAESLAFGDDHPILKSGKLCSVQTLSGTGALRVAGEFLGKFSEDTLLLLSTPTYANHKPLFDEVGLPTKQYRYLNTATGKLNVEGACADLDKAPLHSMVLFQPCGHNPTGVDPSKAEWEKLLAVVKERELIAFFDAAYHGIVSGSTQTDLAPVLRALELDIPIVLCQSFSKNFGLYGERIGCMSLVCSTSEERDRVYSQVKRTIRSMYSSPPLQGARLVHTVLSDPELKKSWGVELGAMATRLDRVRVDLVNELKALQQADPKANEKSSRQDWSCFTTQRGMFSWTSLSYEEVLRLREVHHIYLTDNSRLAVTGLNRSNIKTVAAALKEVTDWTRRV